MEELDRLLRDQARVMYALTTAGGKTRVATTLQQRTYKRFPDMPMAWLTDRTHLRTQQIAEMARAGVRAIDQSKVRPRDRVWLPGVNVIGPMVEMPPLRRGSLMTADETHHAPAPTWHAAIDRWPGWLLGLTGSPWRMSDYEGFDHIYDHLVCGPQPHRLATDGYIAHIAVLRPSVMMDRSRLQVTQTGDGYTVSSADDEAVRLMATGAAVDIWRDAVRHRADKRTMWFTAGKTAARRMTDDLAAEGMPVALILAETPPEERERHLAALAAGDLMHVVSVGTLTEGINVPAVSNLCIMRPTRSWAMYLQMHGRGARRRGDESECLAVDLANNYSYFGHPQADQRWSLEPRAERVGEGDQPAVSCNDVDAGGSWSAVRRWCMCRGGRVPSAVSCCGVSAAATTAAARFCASPASPTCWPIPVWTVCVNRTAGSGRSWSSPRCAGVVTASWYRDVWLTYATACWVW